MDVDFFTQIAKNYDSITRIVRNVSGSPLIQVTADEIRRVFWLNES